MGTGWLLLAMLLVFQPGQGSGQEDEHLARSYLTKYGYMRNRGAMSPAITAFQAFAELKQTGDLDEETMTMMRARRCGGKDVLDQDVDMLR